MGVVQSAIAQLIVAPTISNLISSVAVGDNIN